MSEDLKSPTLEANRICLLCDRGIGELTSQRLGADGIQKLIASSRRRKDKKFLKLKKYNSIVVHGSCRKTYNDDEKIQKFLDKRRSELESSRRSSARLYESFNFNENCLFCGEDASDDFIASQVKRSYEDRRKITFVQKNTTRDTILEICEQRDDEAGNSVQSRIIGESDLVGKGARYHSNCYPRFYGYNSNTSKGRPVDPEIDVASQLVIQHIIENREDSQFSVKKILASRNIVTDSDLLQSIKRRLSLHFHDDVNFHSTDDDLSVMFIGRDRNILTNAWYKGKLKNEEDERMRIVAAAAQIIVEDIRSRYYDQDDCRPQNGGLLINALSDIPSTLQKFLNIVMREGKSEAEAVELTARLGNVGHSIISAVRPRSFVSCMQVGLSSLIHKKYASKELIDCLSYLGVGSNYEEVLRFESSNFAKMQSKGAEDALFPAFLKLMNGANGVINKIE